jgi:hypothetical protein
MRPPQLTDRQRLLACHYIMESWAAKSKVKLSIASVARFMHLIREKPYTGLDNSEFYKELQGVLNSKTDPELIQDLKVVKNVLLQEGFQEAALLVDKRLTLAG